MLRLRPNNSRQNGALAKILDAERSVARLLIWVLNCSLVQVKLNEVKLVQVVLLRQSDCGWLPRVSGSAGNQGRQVVGSCAGVIGCLRGGWKGDLEPA